jgi:uncharacterized damage-inducible protein DinB
MVPCMTYDDLLTLLDYHYWARDRMLTSLESLTTEQYTRDLGNSFRSIRDTVVHIYAAEWVWHSRWIGESPTTFPDPLEFPDVRSIADLWKSQEEKVRSFVESLGREGVDRRFAFTLFNGTATTSVFWEMLQHVVNHGTFHRGQVTTMTRQLGGTPPKSQDLIAFYRLRATPPTL